MALTVRERKRRQRERQRAGVTLLKVAFPDIFGVADWLVDQGVLREWDADSPVEISKAILRYIEIQRGVSHPVTGDALDESECAQTESRRTR
jgi:hypothetical protein